MQKLKNEELLDVTGGGYGLGLLIGGLVVVISGIVDGYLRPLKCHK